MRQAMIALLLVLAATMIMPVRAQGAYSAGKAMEVLVPFPLGGGAGIEARLLAPYFEKCIAGNPRMLIRNMPGGGSMVGANWFVFSAKPDGQMFLTS